MFKPEMLPISRGFDSAFGYLCGSTGYWDHGNTIAFCPDPSDPSSNATITQFALVRRNLTPTIFRSDPFLKSTLGNFWWGQDLHNGTHPALGEFGGRWNGTYETEMYSAALEELLEARDPSRRLFLYIAPK